MVGNNGLFLLMYDGIAGGCCGSIGSEFLLVCVCFLVGTEGREMLELLLEISSSSSGNARLDFIILVSSSLSS